MASYDYIVKLMSPGVLTPNELRKILEDDHGVIQLDKDVDVRRIDRQVRLEELKDLLVTLGDQYGVDISLCDDYIDLGFVVRILRRDLDRIDKRGILFKYDEIYYDSYDSVIHKIVAEIMKLYAPVEKPAPVKEEKLAPRICKCCNAPLPARSNTCEYCGVSYGDPSANSVEVYDNQGRYFTTLYK